MEVWKMPEWTTAELAVLKALYDDGKTHKEIAAALPGRSTKAVGNFISRQNIKRRPKVKPLPIPPRPHIAEERGSERLKIALLKAIVNYANDNGLDVDGAAKRLLSEACG